MMNITPNEFNKYFIQRFILRLTCMISRGIKFGISDICGIDFWITEFVVEFFYLLLYLLLPVWVTFSSHVKLISPHEKYDREFMECACFEKNHLHQVTGLDF